MHHGTGLMCDIRTKINGAKGNRVEHTEIYNYVNHKIRINNDLFLIIILFKLQIFKTELYYYYLHYCNPEDPHKIVLSFKYQKVLSKFSL